MLIVLGITMTTVVYAQNVMKLVSDAMVILHTNVMNVQEDFTMIFSLVNVLGPAVMLNTQLKRNADTMVKKNIT